MDTGPLCSKWNCGSELSGVIRHLEDGAGSKERVMEHGCPENVTGTTVRNRDTARTLTKVVHKGNSRFSEQ